MKVVYRVLAVTLSVMAVASCGVTSNDNSSASVFQLKAYSVPAAQSQAIAQSLDAVLASPGFLVGTKAHSEMRATQPFPGTVMVLAPASVQPSIATAITELARASGQKAAGAPESVSLHVQAWIVKAETGAGDDSSALHVLAPTLTAIRSSLGASHFVLADSATLSIDAPTHRDAVAGNGMLITNRGHKFAFHAVAESPDDIVLGVQLSSINAGPDPSFDQLQTTIGMKPGDYVVAAQSPPTLEATRQKDAALMNLLVVRVDRLDAATH